MYYLIYGLHFVYSDKRIHLIYDKRKIELKNEKKSKTNVNPMELAEYLKTLKLKKVHYYRFEKSESLISDLVNLCLNETNIQIINKFFKIYEKNIYLTTSDGNNIFQFLCEYCNDVPIIKYLYENYFFNLYHKNDYKETYLMRACFNNTNIKIIEFLISKIKNYDEMLIIIYQCCYDNDDLISLSLLNENHEIIWYLIEILKFDLTRVNVNCIHNAGHKYVTELESSGYLLYNRFRLMRKLISLSKKNFINIDKKLDLLDLKHTIPTR